MEQNAVSISKQVRMYIERKPYILEAIEQDIVNFSALAREIGRDLDIENHDTIKVALIRARRMLKKIKEMFSRR